ncbi:MAG: hypothetical protein C0412_15805, partial [Flavobacterium sp.]|nr:hypothetical protein [Flavobacterium sp.]
MENKFEKSKAFVSVLGNKQFLGLWTSQVFSQISTHMVNFALIAKIFEKTGSSIAVSILVFWFAAPAVLVGIFAGVYVDRWDRKRILILINFLQALLVLGYFFVGNFIILIYPIIFLYAALNQFFIPAEGAMIPTIVSKENLLAANSFYIFTNYAAFIIGYAVAGPIIIFLGPNAPFFLASLMLFFATSAAFILPRDQERAANFREENKKTPIFENIKKGLNFIRETKKITFSISHLLLVQVVIAAIIALGPSFAKNSLNISVESTSFTLIAPAGIGVVIGAIVLNKIKGKYKMADLVKFGVISASSILTLLTVLHKVGPFIKNKLLLANGFQVFKYINLLFTISFLVILLG